MPSPTLQIKPTINSITVMAKPHNIDCRVKGISQGNSAPTLSRGIQRIMAVSNMTQLILSGAWLNVFQATSPKKYNVPPHVHRSTDRMGLLYRVIVHHNSVDGLHGLAVADFHLFLLLVCDKGRHPRVDSKGQGREVGQ